MLALGALGSASHLAGIVLRANEHPRDARRHRVDQAQLVVQLLAHGLQRELLDSLETFNQSGRQPLGTFDLRATEAGEPRCALLLLHAMPPEK